MCEVCITEVIDRMCGVNVHKLLILNANHYNLPRTTSSVMQELAMACKATVISGDDRIS